LTLKEVVRVLRRSAAAFLIVAVAARTDIYGSDLQAPAAGDRSNRSVLIRQSGNAFAAASPRSNLSLGVCSGPERPHPVGKRLSDALPTLAERTDADGVG